MEPDALQGLMGARCRHPSRLGRNPQPGLNSGAGQTCARGRRAAAVRDHSLFMPWAGWGGRHGNRLS